MKIINKYFGMSPFSLGEPLRIQNVPKERLSLQLRFDVNNDFSGYLRKNPAEFIFVDLQKLLATLLDVNGHYCTNQPENEDEFYVENQDKIVKVTDFDYEHFYNVFDSFAEIIRENYEPEKIVLLSSYVPEFFTTGQQVRIHKNKFTHNDWYQHFESRFVEKTGCVYYDKSRYYFNEKRAGKAIKYAVFEEQYYDEARKDFALILKGKDFSTQPDYSASVRRYARYYKTLDKKYLSKFLSSDNSVDRFLMSCPPMFALENADDFASLKNNGCKNSFLSTVFENNFIKTYKAFLAAEINPQQDIKNIDLLFKNEIRVPQLLDFVREKSSVDFKKQITYYNYGEFYRGSNPQNLPRVIDVVGTCISRFIFNFNERDFAVNNYAFHYMPFKTDVKASYNNKLFNEKNWSHRMMKLQADCSLSDFVNKCKADWVVIDLFPLIELTAFMLDGKPIGSAGHFGKKKKLEEVLVYEQYTEQEILVELKKYAELLKSLYGDKIILIASRRQLKKVDDINKIVPYTNPQVNNMRNEKCRLYENAFREYTNCWYVDIVDQFLSYDRSFVSVSPAHFEDECYYEEGKIIKKIIDEIPSQKVFTEYDVDVRINRIVKLRESGNIIEDLSAVFRKWQDEILLKLNAEQITENYNFLKNLYQFEKLTPEIIEELKSTGLYNSLCEL